MIGLFFLGMACILIAAVITWFVVNRFVLKRKKETPKFDDLD